MIILNSKITDLDIYILKKIITRKNIKHLFLSNKMKYSSNKLKKKMSFCLKMKLLRKLGRKHLNKYSEHIVVIFTWTCDI